jgi:cytochrome b6-f complex iron-sulfur subunit
MSELVQISRREFVVRSSTGIAIMLGVACVAGGIDAPALSGPVVVTVSNYAALANVGGIVRVNETSTQVALERTSATTFTAFSLVCPHAGGSVQLTGSKSIPFQCPVHGAEFNASGANIGGQQTSSLHAYTAVYDATAGTVTIS